MCIRDSCTDCVPKKKSFRWTPGTRCLSQWSRSNTEFFQESKPDWRKRGPVACVVLNLHTGLVEWFRTHLSKPSPRTVLNTVQRRSFQRLSAPNGKKASSLIYGCILKVKVSTIDINLHTHRSHTCWRNRKLCVIASLYEIYFRYLTYWPPRNNGFWTMLKQCEFPWRR